MDEPAPEAQALLDMIDAVPRPPTYALSVESAREALEQLFADADPFVEVGDVTDFAIEGPAGDVPVRLYTPDGDGDGPLPLLVYYHGGGWVLGSLDSADAVCRALCDRSDWAVLSVNYRHAPEHPFPAPLNDAYAAYEWAVEYADTAGADPGRVAVGGSSAGGNLTAGVTLRARDDGLQLPAHQVLIYPAVASHAVHEFDSYEENAEGYFLERDSMDWFYERYVQDAAHVRNEYLAPLLCDDLSGLPSASVLTAGFDPLRDEGRAYADRLEADGVDVSRHHYEGMIHGFVSLPDVLDAGDDALTALAADLGDAD